MNVNEINAYLQSAREIIGERSRGEVEYDDAVVAYLTDGMDIRKAIAAANRKYPEEALRPNEEHWADLAARYEYLAQHKVILKRLDLRE